MTDDDATQALDGRAPQPLEPIDLGRASMPPTVPAAAEVPVAWPVRVRRRRWGVIAACAAIAVVALIVLLVRATH